MRGEILNCSGSRFFAIATKSINLVTQLLGTLHIAAGQGHRKGKFKLFELVLTLASAAASGCSGGSGAAGLAEASTCGGLG